MTYLRPKSIEISSDRYIELYGSNEKSKSKLFNIGAGAWSHDYWSNIDLPPQTAEFAAIQAPYVAHDLLTQPTLPIESGAADAFYCSHVIEHLPNDNVMNLMQETRRALKVGGVLRIVTGPCCDLDWDAINRQDSDWWYWFDEPQSKVTMKEPLTTMSIYDRWLFSVATARSPWSDTACEKKYNSIEVEKMVKLNKNKYKLLDRLTGGIAFDYASPGNHLSWWNIRKLRKFLKQAGFSIVKHSGYGQSDLNLMRDLRYFDQTYPQISVYIEAFK